MVRRIGTHMPTDSWSSPSPATFTSTVAGTPRGASTTASTRNTFPTSVAAPPFDVASPETKSPRRASMATGSPTCSSSINTSTGPVLATAPPLIKSPRRASVSTGSPTPSGSINTSKGPVCDASPPFAKSLRRASVSTGSPTPSVSINTWKGPVVFAAGPPSTPRRAILSTGSPTPSASVKAWKCPAIPVSSTAPCNAGSKTRAFAPTELPKTLDLTGSNPSPTRSSIPPIAARSSATDELARVMLTAKPSEIRAAAKAGRTAVKAERERQDRMLKEEQAAQMKMNKIRAEIDAIKEKERDCVAKSGGEESPMSSWRNRSDHSKDAAASSAQLINDLNSDLPEDLHDSNIERLLASMEDEATSETELKEMGKRLLVEMEASFAQLSGSSHHARDIELTCSYHNDDLPFSTVAMAIGNKAPRRRELRSTKEDEVEKVPGDKPQRPGRGPSFRRPPRTPSNLVPEMRRRASQRDLLFDDEIVHTSSELLPMSTHSPVTGKDITALPIETKTVQDNQSSMTTIDVKSAHAGSAMTVSPTAQRKDSVQLYSDHHKAASSCPPLGAPLSPVKASSNPQDEGGSPNQRSPRTSDVGNIVTVSPQTPIRDSLRLTRMEEEKRKLEAQRKKLDEAREYFQYGHDLCWKFQDSSSALGQYRKALFIRESLLGKYHDETGRSYYWIGRSLVKLKEYDEALVAFSRALRIFERVLARNHKYRRWAEVAIAAVFREMDDPDADYTSYKQTLDDSISHERAGDAYRKKKVLALAISEYRAAIENIEEYHPDAADLHCKIAIILRQQGEFEKALEENRSALEIYELSLGAEHPETVKTLNQTMEKKRLQQVSLALMEKLNLGN